MLAGKNIFCYDFLSSLFYERKNIETKKREIHQNGDN
jgi:hypothetical protein